MKKILIILFLLIATPSFAWTPCMTAVVSSGGAASADPCGCPTSTYMFCYTGDYSGDTDKACFTNGTAAKDGEEVDTGTNVSITSTSISFTAVDNYVQWALSSKDGFDSTAGTIFFSVYINGGGDVNSNSLIELIYSQATDRLAIQSLDSGNLVRIAWEDNNGGAVGQDSVAALTENTWYRIGVAWNTVGTDMISVSVVAVGNATSWVDGNGDEIAPFATEPAYIVVGEKASTLSTPDACQIKDIIILNTYKGTDPF